MVAAAVKARDVVAQRSHARGQLGHHDFNTTLAGRNTFVTEHSNVQYPLRMLHPSNYNVKADNEKVLLIVYYTKYHTRTG